MRRRQFALLATLAPGVLALGLLAPGPAAGSTRAADEAEKHSAPSTDRENSVSLIRGLVERYTTDRAALDTAARALAAEIAGNPPLVVRGVKQILDQATRRDVA